MNKMYEDVPFQEAFQQVRIAMSRLALLHLAFSRTLVNQIGEEHAEELILKSIMEYGRLIEEYATKKKQESPFYGIHGKYMYNGEEYKDTRDFLSRIKDVDFSLLEIYDCSLAEVFMFFKEKKLGKLYCYIDAAKSMANDPYSVAIHTKCVLCGDDYCQIDVKQTTDDERISFKESKEDWKNIDPILL